MPSPKILIVGDDAASLKALITSAGFSPICASAGSEAVERAKAEVPDLILVDVVTPPKDGYEACRQLQAEVAIRHIPVIVVSTRSEQMDQLWARLQGASNLLPKACGAEELVGAIRNALI